MPDKKQILDELNYLTDAISARFRAVSASVLAVCWAFILSEKPETKLLDIKEMAAPLILSLLSFTFDMCQYIFGYLNNLNMLRDIERIRADSIVYSKRSWLYRGRIIMFWLKILTAILSVVTIIVLLLEKILRV